MARSAEEKAKIKDVRDRLKEMTAAFCVAHLDAEHAELAGKLVDKLGRKRQVPFLSGSAEVWAAGIVYALAQINSLFDRDVPVYTSPDEIAAFFGCVKTTAGAKAKAIRDLLKLRYCDPQFSDARAIESNPFRDWVEVGGLIGRREWFGLADSEIESDDEEHP